MIKVAACVTRTSIFFSQRGVTLHREHTEEQAEIWYSYDQGLFKLSPPFTHLKLRSLCLSYSLQFMSYLFSLYLTPVLYYLSFHISFLRQTRTFLFPRNCVSTSLFFSTWYPPPPTHSYRSYRGCLIRVWRDLCVKSGGGCADWVVCTFFINFILLKLQLLRRVTRYFRLEFWNLQWHLLLKSGIGGVLTPLWAPLTLTSSQ